MTVDYMYEEAFGASDLASPAMRAAIDSWFDLYFGAPSPEADPCQRIAYTVVNKLTKTVFAEYRAVCPDPFGAQVLEGLDRVRRRAMQMTLIGGECALKPCPQDGGFSFTVIPRTRCLIFGRDRDGQPTDVGLVEQSDGVDGSYTLLERRTLGPDGRLTISNRLFRAQTPGGLGRPVALSALPRYAALREKYTYPRPLGSTGLVWLRTPMVNCVDGGPEGVAVFAPAAGLIRAIDRNEFELSGEFRRGQSRVLASRDLLDEGQLRDELFIALDEDPDRVGLTVFSPQLREGSYLARKQEYLRNVESVIGLKRGLLSQVEAAERTATEITSSAGDYCLTVMEFQDMWTRAVDSALAVCARLGEIYRVPGANRCQAQVDWGNGVLYDEEKTWADYLDMVDRGLIRPEAALGWRFNMPAETPEDRKRIRRRFMEEVNT